MLDNIAAGAPYAHDLRRIEASLRATPADVDRARALASYLVDLHREKIPGHPARYHRAIRDLIGGGEGLFGIIDSYPDGGPIPRKQLTALEHRAVAWRARLRDRSHRLCRTHGEFHPSNLLFREGVDFTPQGAGREAIGDAADDVAALAMSYVIAAVLHPRSWRSGIGPLWLAFWVDYLAGSADGEVLEVIAPFFAQRALAAASPLGHPDLTEAQRQALIGFTEHVMDGSAFDPLDTSSFAPE